MITDIAFCDPQRGSNLVRAISARIPSVDIKWIYFENVPERCRRNILRRAAQSLTSDLEMLDRFATVYRIPDGVTPRPVYGE